jgi:hypothetical protein
MHGTCKSWRVALPILLLVSFSPGSVRAASLILNGGFESGFTNWNVADETGGATSGWLIQTGTMSPLNMISVPAPPQGSQAAMTDAGGAGSHALYQSFTVASGSTVTLAFDLFVGNQAGFFTPSPESLDFNVIPNQQARVDILSGTTSTANAFTLSSVVDNVLDPSVSTLTYTHYSFNITNAVGAGGTFTLRFAEVDNQNIFNLGVDNVSIVTSAVTVPEPSSGAAMGTLGVMLIALAAKYRARNASVIRSFSGRLRPELNRRFSSGR